MRSSGLVSVNPTARQRRWWAGLAIVALAFLSLRPACDVWLSHWDKHKVAHHAMAHQSDASAPAHEPHEPMCCTSIESGALVKSADMVVPRGEQAKPPVATLFTQTAFRVAAPLLQSLTASVIPPGSPPFYVRSARILR